MDKESTENNFHKNLFPEECKHEINPDTIEYDKKYGRRGKCKHCGCKVVQFRYARTKTSRVHMSKKERLRKRRELKTKMQEERKDD